VRGFDGARIDRPGSTPHPSLLPSGRRSDRPWLPNSETLLPPLRDVMRPAGTENGWRNTPPDQFPFTGSIVGYFEPEIYPPRPAMSRQGARPQSGSVPPKPLTPTSPNGPPSPAFDRHARQRAEWTFAQCCASRDPCLSGLRSPTRPVRAGGGNAARGQRRYRPFALAPARAWLRGRRVGPPAGRAPQHCPWRSTHATVRPLPLCFGGL